MKAESLIIGGEYNFKNQPERLKYIGAERGWHQFELTGRQGVWSELLDCDLHMIEATISNGEGMSKNTDLELAGFDTADTAEQMEGYERDNDKLSDMPDVIYATNIDHRQDWDDYEYSFAATKYYSQSHIDELNAKHGIEYKESMALMQKNFDDTCDLIQKKHVEELKAVHQDLGLCEIQLSQKINLLNACEEALQERDIKHEAELKALRESCICGAISNAKVSDNE